MKRLFSLTSLFVILFFVASCSPEISFFPTNDPNTEVEGDGNEENTENEGSENEGSESEGDGTEGDGTEGDGNEGDGTEEQNPDEPTQPDQGNEEEIEPNGDIDPWTGAVADDVSRDVVGSDNDLFVELNSFTNRVVVRFDGNSATVENTNSAIVTHISGAYVTIDFMTNNVDGVEIVAQGKSSDGGLKIYGEKKFKLVLNGLDIASKRGPAINSQCGKRVYLHLADGTTNRISDSATYADDAYTLPGVYNEDRKGALFTEGHIILSGHGVLVAKGNYKHAIVTDGYYYQRPGSTVVVTAAAKNALHVKGDDEDAIGAWFAGGRFEATVASTAGKGVKSDLDIKVDGGKLNITTSGNAEYVSSESDTSSAAALKADGSVIINGGELEFLSTGSGGKGINADGGLTFNGGVTNIKTTGTQYKYSNSITSSPKGIRVDGAIVINDGVINIEVTGKSEGSEGMESKSTIAFNGGETMVNSYDDGINAKSDITIKGGKIYTYGTNNDGMDSNGSITMEGGLVIGVGSTSPETGVDVDVSSKWKINGGTMIGFGGSMMASPSTASAQCMLVYNGLSTTAGQVVTLLDSSDNVIVSFEYPLTRTGATLLLSCPEIVKNSTYKVWQGGTISNPYDEWLYWSVKGSISGGSQLNTFTPTSIITTIGTSSGGGPGGGGGGGNRPPWGF
ncbi:MAG: carbohydrate-binding domain-containing protein [Alistipes sp.]|nr:carbohydrate-binding domain-containing protein [Alistipes sp.]